jgi:inner membrane protein
MGSLLLFVLLGVFMSLTRKVDWYSLGSTMAAVNKEPS